MLAPELQDLPAEVLEAMGENTPLQDSETLHRLANTIVSLRTEAIDARKASGIEELWMQCEEAYIGIDDANRSEFANATWSKPMALNGPLTSESFRRDAVRSTAFLRLTSRYVDAGAAKLAEIALPMDGHAFSLNPIPDPDLVKMSDDETPATMQGVPVINQPEQPGQQPTQASVADVAQHDMGIASTKAEKAENRILDWLLKSKFRTEMRKVIFDAARLGCGILKGPYPILKKSSAATKADDGTYEIEIVEKTFPGVVWKDPWTCYPDASCGDDIQNGEYFFDFDPLSKRKLAALKKDKTYLSDMIDKVIEEGPQNEREGSNNPTEKQSLKDKRFKVWNFYGSIKRSEFTCACADRELSSSVKEDDVNAIVSIVNNTIIKAVINPSPSGKFPHQILGWQRRAGSWAGIGIAEQISMPQRAVNGSVRAMFDNAGISSGIQIVLDRGAIEPADGNWNIGRNKLWYKKADATIDDVSKAFATFEVPCLQAQLMALVDWGMKQGEESTNIPLVTQGFSGTSTPDTYGAALLQNNNANQLLRDVGHRLDDAITEPMIYEYYDYLLLDPDIPEDEKGAFDIDAHGTAALVERYIQSQEMMQLLQISLNPAYGLNPKLAVEQVLKAKHFDPTKFQYTEQELAAQEHQQPAMAPVVQAAQVHAQSAIQIQQAKDQTAIQIESERSDRQAQYQQALKERDAANASVAEMKLEIMRNAADLNERLKMMEFSMKKGISLDAIKAEIAQTSAKLQTEERLAMANLTHGKSAEVNPVMSPPVQTPGRADNGQAFEQT